MKRFLQIIVVCVALLLVSYTIFPPQTAYADTSVYRPAGWVATDGSPAYSNTTGCQISNDGLYCSRVNASSYGNLYFSSFGNLEDFGIPAGSFITKLHIRVKGKNSAVQYIGVNSAKNDMQFLAACNTPGDLWPVFLGQNDNTVETHTFTSSNGLTDCVAASNIDQERLTFRLHRSSGSSWSADIDNFEIAFDYTPHGYPWKNQDALSIPRNGHKATLLDNGKVLVAGGIYVAQSTNIVEIFTPGSNGTGTWAHAKRMNHDRKFHTLHLIDNQQTGSNNIIAIGGAAEGCSCIRNSAELYDPSSNTWTMAPNLNDVRAFHGSSVLEDGNVLVSGGISNTSSTAIQNSTEAFDTTTNTWTLKAPLNTARAYHNQVTFIDATGNSKAMVIGGGDASGKQLSSTEIYDPSSNTWSLGPNMNSTRYNYFSAITLHDGRILVVGGNTTGDSEVYDPLTNQWTTYPTSYTFYQGSVVELGSETNYKVLAAGSIPVTTNAMLFDPQTGTWTNTDPMNSPRADFTLTLLKDGTTLAANGLSSYQQTRTSEIYTLSEITPTPSPNPTLTPFLDLPWDYEGKGLTFNEAAMSINSYFDHEYPLLSIPLSEPDTASGSVVTFQGPERTDNWYSSHDGYDYGKIAKANIDDPVLAAASGSATYVDSCSACGNMIVIDHENGYQTRYLHLQKNGLIIATTAGSIKVDSKQQIGLIGVTGNTTGAHIHFGVFQDKNNDSNFADNVPDGVTDPYGWQSQEPDPWEIYSFFYNGIDRTGNKSFYLWRNKLDGLDANFSSNGGIFSAGRYTVSIPQGATTQNLTLEMQASPIVKVNDSLVSIGSTMNITAKDELGNLGALFTKPLTITIDFTQFDLSRFKPSTISIYSSADNIHWVKEESLTDYLSKKATTETSHLTYFALMAERIDTIAPTTTAAIVGQQGDQNWFRSDAVVNLNAQDNENGLGVDYTLYKVEGDDWQQYTIPLLFADEGHHKIEFYSVDKDENIEQIKSVEFDIDKTLPEAKIFIDQGKQDVVVEGIDTNQTTVEKLDNTETNRKDDAVYIIKDVAGNMLQLDVRDRDNEKKDAFRMHSLRYNQDMPIDQPNNRYRVSYNGKKDELIVKEQNFELKGEVKIRIQYDASNNESTIVTKESGEEKVKEIQPGLILLLLSTENGAIKYSY